MRLLVLAHDALGPRTAKTANAVVKYAREGWSGDEVVAVVDRSKAGQDAGDHLGPHGRGIPVVASVADGLRLGAEGLVIGIAPGGGALPADWTPDLLAALQSGVRVVSGLHTPIGTLPAFSAYRHLVRDVRHEHPPQRITGGEGLIVDALVVLHVGTDCNSGKMTSAIELTKEARRRGLRAAFVATGQTGIMVGCDAGAPIDALVSDFVAGAVEECVLKAALGNPDVIFVEGQGSLDHPAYSGVTASLLHGSFPDVLVLADEPRREFLTLKGVVKFRKQGRTLQRDLNELHLRPTTAARVGAVALMTPGLSDAVYEEEIGRAEKEMGVPAADAFRGGAGRILDGVLAEARRIGLWGDKGFVRGSKASRVATGVL